MEKLFNPDYLIHLCQKYGLQPSKQYGQNFLINPEPIEKMLEAGEAGAEDIVVEIGPGFGVLTLALAEKVKKVIAFEIEKRLMPYWDSLGCHSESPGGGEESLSGVRRIEISRCTRNDKRGEIKIIWGNVLRISKSQFPISKYKVIANLPYQITSAAIRLFLEIDNPPETMILMVQKEVAERICASPGEMSVLAVSVQYYAKPEIIAQVPRADFWPQPKVDSAVIKITIKKQEMSSRVERSGIEGSLPPTLRDSSASSLRDSAQNDRTNRSDQTEEFFKLVKIGFANRRKMLLKNLEPIWGKKNKESLRQIFAKIGLSEKARAQELSVEQWTELSTYLPGEIVV